MSNEEPKKKIVEILEETEHEWVEDKNGYILQIFYDKLADALIAAGIGDVKEAEHRAEVLERALDKACKLLKLDCSTMFNKYGCPDERIDLSCTVCRKQWLIEKVEKELAAEGKDENN